MKRILFCCLTLLLLLSLFSLTIVHSQEVELLIPDLAAELNLWRLELGLGPLVHNLTLEAMANAQAEYVAGLADIPSGGDIHIDAQGQDARQRSQRAPYNWPTYGNPQRISLTEIAAVGNLDSALAFWRGSDLHNRSVTNVAYREIGIAVRQLENVSRDVLFIVVLGGRPNVLTALADPEVGNLYLTTEANTWTGDWFSTATSYRLLDAERQPIWDWDEWQVIVDLPEDTGGTFFVEYEDSTGRRAETEVSRSARWTNLLEPEQVVQNDPRPTSTRSSGGGLIFVTNTPSGFRATPTATAPADNSVTLLYAAGVFTLIPNGEFTDITGLFFRNETVVFDVRRWEEVVIDINIGALPSANCLQVWQQDAGEFEPPAQCEFVRAIVFRLPSEIFWAAGEFEVLKDDEVLTTCLSSAGQCDVTLP
jgi:Cysteine-rich secretory protein family